VNTFTSFIKEESEYFLNLLKNLDKDAAIALTQHNLLPSNEEALRESLIEAGGDIDKWGLNDSLKYCINTSLSLLPLDQDIMKSKITESLNTAIAILDAMYITYQDRQDAILNLKENLEVIIERLDKMLGKDFPERGATVLQQHIAKIF